MPCRSVVLLLFTQHARLQQVKDTVSVLGSFRMIWDDLGIKRQNREELGIYNQELGHRD
jgi:hypothetical protein